MRRQLLVAAVVVLAAAGIWFGMSGRSLLGSSPTTTTAPPPTSTTTTVPPTNTTTTTPVGPPATIGAYQVATAQLTLVENPGPTQRPLPTTIWYPETGGARPLLVFSQGFWTAVATYDPLITDWASAGFVVAAPTYPHTNPPPHEGTPSTPTGTNIKAGEDIVHHPADLRFVIQSVLSTAGQAGNALTGRIDPSEVGLVGHSDGGDVSLAVAADSAQRTASVKAVAVLSGAELVNFFGGTYFTPSLPAVPLLAVQSRTDTVSFPSCSVQLYDGAPQPKWYLQLDGVSHLAGYMTAPTRTVVARVTTRFFDAELAHQASAMATVSSVADTAVSTISNGPQAPAQPGPPDCDATP